MDEKEFRAKLEQEKNRTSANEIKPPRTSAVSKIGRPLGTSLREAAREEDRATEYTRDSAGTALNNYRIALILQKALRAGQQKQASPVNRAAKSAVKLAVRKIVLWLLLYIGPWLLLTLLILLLIVFVVIIITSIIPDLPSYRYEGSDTDSFGDYWYGV